MNILYENIDNNYRSYHGITVDEQQCRRHLQGTVKDNLLDREERENALHTLRALQQETGFNASNELICGYSGFRKRALGIKTISSR